MTAQPRPEGTCYWCMKDKPGPTRLVGGPSLAASELCDMVSNMGTFTWDVAVTEAMRTSPVSISISPTTAGASARERGGVEQSEVR